MSSWSDEQQCGYVLFGEWTTNNSGNGNGGRDSDGRRPSISAHTSLPRRRSIAELPLCQWLIEKLRQFVRLLAVD